jgi:hypothetical protein
MPRRKPEKPAARATSRKRAAQQVIDELNRGPLTDEDADEMIETVETVDDDEAEQ